MTSMTRRRCSAFRAWAMAIACALPGALGFDAQADITVNDRVPTWAPDVFGGYSTEWVIAQARPDVMPIDRADGRPGFAVLGARAQDAVVARQSDETARLLALYGATRIERATPFEPAHAALAQELGLDRYYLVHVPSGTDTPSLVAQLSLSDRIFERVELDGVGGVAAPVYPNDTYFSLLYGMHNTGQTIQGQAGTPDADIDAPEAWELHTGGTWVVLAVIDSGVNAHGDLSGKLVPGRNTNNNTNDTSDPLNHGTHCAGTAAANGNNGLGVVGVSWGARVMPIRVLNSSGSGTETHCANGIIWAADNGAHVGTMSLQYYSGTSYFQSAVQYGYGAGMVLVAATGNNQGNVVAFPARWPETIAVGAVDNRDIRPSFSNYGPQITVCAPGVNVASLSGTSSYAYNSGTSMATPHVAGLACLLRSYGSSLTNAQIADIIRTTAEDRGAAGFDQFYGWGRINARDALLAAGGSPPPPPPPPPGPQLAPLGSYAVEQGSALNSGLARLTSSDNQWLSINSVWNASRHRTRLRVNATSPVTSVSRLDLRFETGASRNSIPVRIDLMRQDSGVWVQVASYTQNAPDTIWLLQNVPNPQLYVNASTGAVSARFRTEATNSVGSYTFHVDFVEVIVTP
ncbi:MAG: S8 family serine peptidase [Phycisphaeraceae bacterium]|nr:S8 family serine peptidase [Phycisphaeraceae bacterium]